MAAAAGDHAGEQGAHGVDEASDIGRNHRFPIGDVGFGGGLEAERETGVSEDDIDAGKFGGERGNGGVDGGAVLHIKLDDVAAGGAEFGLQFLEAITPAAGRDHLAARSDIAACGGGAKAGGGAGDEDDKALGIEQLVHGNVLKG